MTRNTLIFSFIFHIGLIYLFTKISPTMDTKPIIKLSSPIKINFSTNEPEIVKKILAENPLQKKSSSSKKKSISKPKQTQGKNLTSLQGENKQGSASKILKYEQLLPADSFEYYKNAKAQSENTRSNEKEIFAKQARHASKLIAFANELAEIISIPSALVKIEPEGSAKLFFSRSGEAQWKTTKAKGDPYFRALLYETLNKLSPNLHGLVMLSAAELDSVEIIFQFRTFSFNDSGIKPVALRIDGDKIFITMTQIKASSKWQLLNASKDSTGRDIVSVDLIGLGLNLANGANEEDPYQDHELQTLRLSPAYIKPIGE